MTENKEGKIFRHDGAKGRKETCEIGRGKAGEREEREKGRWINVFRIGKKIH